MFKSCENDPRLESENSYKAMIKIYTHNAIFRHVAKIMPAAEFSKIQTYLAAVMLGTEKYSMKYCYKTYNKPIYRGLNPNKRFNLNDYPLNSIG